MLGLAMTVTIQRVALLDGAVKLLTHRTFTPAGYSSVLAARRGDPLILMLWLSYRLSSMRLPRPAERNEKPISAQSVFERE